MVEVVGWVLCTFCVERGGPLGDGGGLLFWCWEDVDGGLSLCFLDSDWR